MINFFEQELRNLLTGVYAKTTYVGRKAYVQIDEKIKACVFFDASENRNRHDTIRVNIINRNDGRVDGVVIRLKDLLGKKASYSRYFPEGVNPHIYDGALNGEIAWYGFNPSEEDYDLMRNAILSYIDVFE